MYRPRLDILAPLICGVLLAGCGGEIARIEGLPETRDVSTIAWPRLVDTPAPPADSLLPEAGAAAFASLNETRQSVLTRAAQPGPPRIAIAELDGRVARIRQQSTIREPGVDGDDLAARAARLSQVRNRPAEGIDASDLLARGQRVAAARIQVPDSLDPDTLAARANRLKSQVQSYGGTVNRADLALRSQRIETAVATVPPTRALRPAQIERPDVVSPPKPIARQPDRSTPVISDAFRKRAEEARKRARDRAKAATAQ